MSDNRQTGTVPYPIEPMGSTERICVNIEPEAKRMLDQLVERLYPGRRIGVARALVVEMALRGMHRGVMGDAGSEE